jgi:hypothetical protein
LLLLVIQSMLRVAPVMHGVVKDLNRDQMQAVAFFTQLMHHPAEATFVPGNIVQGPIASSSLP